MYTIEFNVAVVVLVMRCIFEALFIAGFLRVKAKPWFIIEYVVVCLAVGIFVAKLTKEGWIASFAHFSIMLTVATLLLRKFSSSVLAPCVIAETIFALANALCVLVFQWAEPAPPTMPRFILILLPNVMHFTTQLMACFMLMWILKKHNKSDGKYMTTYMPLLLLPCLLTIFVTHFHWNMWLVSEHVGSLIILLFAVLAFAAVLVAFYRLTEAAKKEATRVNIEQQVKAQHQYVAEAKQRNEHYSSFRHDINNHFLVLSGLVSSGKNAEAELYLKKIRTCAENTLQVVNTGNIVLDVLLGEKIAYAQSEGICVPWDMHLPADMGIDDFDLCILFANAIDNAIAGCMESADDEKTIGMVVKAKNNFLFIQIENNCAPQKQVVWGTGLKNMKATADKYGGSIETEVKESHFVVRILLCMPTK